MASVLKSVSPRPPRSLQAIEAGEKARIGSILFERLRRDCRDLGLEPGQEVVCRAAGPEWLVLRVSRGRTSRCVLLPRDWARFIELE